MPELPEVETIVRDLSEVLPGQKFLRLLTVFKPAVLPNVAAFTALKGCVVEGVARRGKYIVIFFKEDFVVVLHLRMTGRLHISLMDKPLIPFERTRLEFDNVSLRFGDIRKFGKVYLGNKKNYAQISGIAKLGPEPLALDFSVADFARSLSRGKRPLKAALLDQSVVAGIGNIYADESCFAAGIRPERGVNSLSEDELSRLFACIRCQLEDAIVNRGTSFSDFEDAYGRRGENQNFLRVYGRGNLPCFECESLLAKTSVAGRGTVYCPQCQV